MILVLCVVVSVESICLRMMIVLLVGILFLCCMSCLRVFFLSSFMIR